jgi:hypothetical protein
MPNKPWKQAAYMHSSGVSVRQWALSHNVNYFNIRQHILNGMSPDEACLYAQTRTGRHDTNNKHYINGINLAEYCRQYKLNYDKMLTKINRGELNVNR